MRLIKIGAANINTTVGAFSENTDRLIALAKRMSRSDCTLGCFQEQTIAGYPAEDYNHFDGFITEQWKEFERFVSETEALSPIYVVGVAICVSGGIYNCAAVVHKGKILGLVPKEELPNYNIFHDIREYAGGLPGQFELVKKETGEIPFGDIIFNFPFGTIATSVCEDDWSANGPMGRRAFAGAEIVVNLSASPFRSCIANTRREMLATRSADNEVVLVYTSQVGGNDGLVFDGHILGYQNGTPIMEGKRWEESYITRVVDLDQTSQRRRENTTRKIDWRNHEASGNNTVRVLDCEEGPIANQPGITLPAAESKYWPFVPPKNAPVCNQEEYFEDLIQAAVMGLTDYFLKSGAFECFIIGDSGGKDSALCKYLCAMAALKIMQRLPAEKRIGVNIDTLVRCYSMPTVNNSDQTKSIARMMSEELEVSFSEISIQDLFEATLADYKATLPEGMEPGDIALQNMQARIRGTKLLNLSNDLRGMVIVTGNMTEKAVGYFTLGGDGEGAFAPLANLSKTTIIKLLQYISRKYMRRSKSLEILLKTVSTAELKPGQSDEKELGPFPILDMLIDLISGKKMMPDEAYLIIRRSWTDDELRGLDPNYETGKLKEWIKKFVWRFFTNTYKWSQCPKGIHYGRNDLEIERTLFVPVVTSLQWLRPSLKRLEELPD